jgi:hypothetical protein
MARPLCSGCLPICITASAAAFSTASPHMQPSFCCGALSYWFKQAIPAHELSCFK